jgi:hypothetical protein
MGIKDWLGGDKFKELLGRDKKKDEYREAVKEAVSDGKLDTEEIKNLEELRKELDVSSVAEDRTVMRREIYNEAVQAVRKEGEFTATDAHDLNKIQKFLALRDDQVEQTKWNLARLRVLTEIRQGNYPTVASSNVALRGVQLEPEEIAHYTVAVELFDQSMTRGNDGVAIAWGVAYESGAARIHGIPESGAKPVGEGNVIVTNKRLILKTGNRMASVKYGREAHVSIYGDGIRLAKTVGNTLLKFKSGSEETGEIVAELVSAFMR